MKKRIVLPTETVEVLQQFGDISTVINDILSLAEQSKIPAYNLPPIADKYDKYKKVTVYIDNTWFIHNSNMYNSLNLRRIIQNFVDNELFNEFNWQVSTTNNNMSSAIMHLHLAETHLLTALQSLSKDTTRDKQFFEIENIRTQLSQIREELK